MIASVVPSGSAPRANAAGRPRRCATAIAASQIPPSATSVPSIPGTSTSAARAANACPRPAPRFVSWSSTSSASRLRAVARNAANATISAALSPATISSRSRATRPRSASSCRTASGAVARTSESPRSRRVIATRRRSAKPSSAKACTRLGSSSALVNTVLPCMSTIDCSGCDNDRTSSARRPSSDRSPTRPGRKDPRPTISAVVFGPSRTRVPTRASPVKVSASQICPPHLDGRRPRSTDTSDSASSGRTIRVPSGLPGSIECQTRIRCGCRVMSAKPATASRTVRARKSLSGGTVK